IVAEADAMSNFDNISGLFKAAFIYENLNQKEGEISVLEKLERKYNKLHFKESKKIIKPKIEAVRILLK
ncbi:metal-dependent phosphohydrolase, partial [bacterium]|nr:metal-dependent phosphohydrolase [bacterium]